MEDKIPKNKPSLLLVTAITLSVAVHLGLFIAIQLTPTPEKDFRGTYDYLSSAVWEIYGPTGIIRLIDVEWPTALAENRRILCTDPESALDGIDPGSPLHRWCAPAAIAERGGGERR
jgi:hypothetical protein